MVYLDEQPWDVSMRRTRGRAPKGKPAIGTMRYEAQWLLSVFAMKRKECGPESEADSDVVAIDLKLHFTKVKNAEGVKCMRCNACERT